MKGKFLVRGLYIGSVAMFIVAVIEVFTGDAIRGVMVFGLLGLGGLWLANRESKKAGSQ